MEKYAEPSFMNANQQVMLRALNLIKSLEAEYKSSLDVVHAHDIQTTKRLLMERITSGVTNEMIKAFDERAFSAWNTLHSEKSSGQMPNYLYESFRVLTELNQDMLRTLYRYGVRSSSDVVYTELVDAVAPRVEPSA